MSGSDEHGTAIEVEAIRTGTTPYRLSSRNHRLITKLMKTMKVEFSNYTRTHSPTHIRFVREFYKRVELNGYVYSQVLKLPYCETDKRFLPDRFVEGECPYCHFPKARGDQCDNCSRVLDPTDLINPYCAICGNTPIIKESKHWFFDLPKLTGELAEYIQQNRNLPENARNFSTAWLKEGLKPRSLTRDNRWGIPAPFKGAEKKTIYVWMEAVLGYLSATKEWAEKKRKPSEWKKFWLDPESKNVHFIGKDNIPFHTIVFPGLLLASRNGYDLPWQISSTEFFLFDGQKFSKSRRIGVWMDEALKIAGPEYWRFALISLRPELKDTNFTWEEFERKINTELNDVIGNFIHRTLSFIRSNFEGLVPEYDSSKESRVLSLINDQSNKTKDALDHFRLKEALGEVVELGRLANRFLNEKEPWHQIKKDKTAAGQTLGIAVQFVSAIADLIYPFLPVMSTSVRKSIGHKGPPEWPAVERNMVRPGTRITQIGPLFHKVSAKEMRDKLSILRKTNRIEAEN